MPIQPVVGMPATLYNGRGWVAATVVKVDTDSYWIQQDKATPSKEGEGLPSHPKGFRKFLPRFWVTITTIQCTAEQWWAFEPDPNGLVFQVTPDKVSLLMTPSGRLATLSEVTYVHLGLRAQYVRD